MKHKHLTISVGIPAYNEEANIGVLLESLLTQRCSYDTVKEIVVISDGSTDQTVAVASSVKDKRIRVISQSKRQGQNAAQNEITQRVSGDILVLLNADVLPVNEYMLDELIKPFLKSPKVGIVGGNTVGVRSRTFVEWALNTGHQFKQSLYFRLHVSQETIYLCHGRVRAFSKEVYSSIQWPDDCPEDAYSFLYCLTNTLRFVFAPQAMVRFRSPQTIQEHAKQSIRFLHGINGLKAYFPASLVTQTYTIPWQTFVSSLIEHGVRHPFGIVAYFCITLLAHLLYRSKYQTGISRWDISLSSKRII